MSDGTDGGFLKNVKQFVQHFSPNRTKLNSPSSAEQATERITKTPLEISVDVDSSSESEQEDDVDYKRGGYHRVAIGNTFNNRYRVIRKLGWGHFSTVWLAEDLEENKYVALKIVKSARNYTEAAEDEIKLLDKVKNHSTDSTTVVLLYDHFKIEGPHGVHVCMVFEVLGANLLKMIRVTKHRGLPVPLVKAIAKQMLEGLHLLHKECGIIHTDLKPENILLCLSPSEIGMLAKNSAQNTPQNHSSTLESELDITGAMQGVKLSCSLEKDFSIQDLDANHVKVKLADLGNACWTNRHFTSDIQTRQYRAPEVILGHPYDTTVDIWSAACIIFELLTGDFLFTPKSGRKYDKNEDHVALMMELLGEIPKNFANGGKFSREIFNRRGELRHIRELEFWKLADVLREKYNFSSEESKIISDFLLPMLQYIPKKRISAAEALKHPWLEL